MKFGWVIAVLMGAMIGSLAAIEVPAVEESQAGVAKEESIAVSDLPGDEEIRSRLLKIFGAVESLKDLEVTVDSGVVALEGEVTEARDVKDAVALAGKTEGVVYVFDRVGRATQVEKRLAPAIRKTAELWDAAVRKLPLFLIALVVIVLFWGLGKWLIGRDGLFSKLGMSELSSSMAKQVIRLGLLAMGLVIALEILDATALVGAFLGVAGVMGVALGFAFRNIIENYLAGILLSIRNPFSAGDVIEVEGFTGKVIRLTTRDTVLMTLEGNHLRIPNRIIIGSTLLNFTRNPLRRFDFAVGVSVEQDLVAVRELGLETLELIAAILDDPAPWVVVEELGDSTVNMRFFAWLDQNKSDYLKTKSEAIRLIKEKFDEVGIEMPEPIYRVHLTNRTPVVSDSEGGKPQGPKRKSEVALDTSVDRTIDEQIERVENTQDEPDLLEEPAEKPS
ncbi:mechanosensitive ion channel domain-containing protein [Haloferula chungangensis]|uniref:Mechanosensitive ion channel domain-containing protein n=1 Tax=Haloferula chungangensis TaxID=1048331 RepID=A0ABW2LDE1_9BACT